MSGDDYCAVLPYDTYLHYKANGPYPLGLCDGDCDHDGDCATGLYCYRRSEFEPVPGCDGLGSRGKDYCIPESKRPTLKPLVTVVNNRPRHEFPLIECEGDCDGDKDCQV